MPQRSSSTGSLLSWLTRMCRDQNDPNIVGVGVGYGLKDGCIDLQRPYCARFYVHEKFSKRKAVRQPLCIPSEMRIPRNNVRDTSGTMDALSRKVRSSWIELPTDVHELGDIAGSSGLVELNADPDIVSAGTIVRWKSGTKVRWGIVTVAHGFESAPSSSTSEDITISLPTSGATFVGKRIVNFNPVSLGVDATLIEVPVSRLIDVGLLADEHPVVKVPPPYTDLKPENFPTGTSLQTERSIPFSVIGPVNELAITNVGTVKELVHIQGPSQAFVHGTSGSLLRLLDANADEVVPAAIQIGATAPSFSHAYGQSLRKSLTRIRAKLVSSTTHEIGPMEVVGSF